MDPPDVEANPPSCLSSFSIACIDKNDQLYAAAITVSDPAATAVSTSDIFPDVAAVVVDAVDELIEEEEDDDEDDNAANTSFRPFTERYCSLYILLYLSL